MGPAEEAHRALRPRPLPRGLDALSLFSMDPWRPVSFDWGSPHPWFLTPWVEWVDLSTSEIKSPALSPPTSPRIGMAWVRLAHSVVHPPLAPAVDLSDYRAKVPKGTVVGFSRAVEIVPRPGCWAISVSGVPGRQRGTGRVATGRREGPLPSREVLVEAWTALLQHLASFDLLPLFVGDRFDEVPARALLRWMAENPSSASVPAPKKAGHRGWIVPEVSGVRETRLAVRAEADGLQVKKDEDGAVVLGPWRLTRTSAGYPRWVRYWLVAGVDGVPEPSPAVVLAARGPSGPWAVELCPLVVGALRILEGAVASAPVGSADSLREIMDSAMQSIGLVVEEDRGETWRWPLHPTAMVSFSSIVEARTSLWASRDSAAPVSSPKHGRRSRR